MDDERRQRQMDFILEQNALFAEEMRQANRRTDRLERIVKLAIRAGARERGEWRERYNALVNAQIRTEDSQQRTEENMRLLEEHQLRANENQRLMEERQLRTEEHQRLAEEHWQRVEENQRRAEEHQRRMEENLQRTEELTHRNSVEISRVSADIKQLAEIVRLGTATQNGNSDKGTNSGGD